MRSRPTPTGVVKRPQRMRMDLIEKLPKRVPPPGELNTIDDLQREWQRIHRIHWRGQITDAQYSTLQYGMQTGTGITKIRDELARTKEELAHARAIEAASLARANPQYDLELLDAAELAQLEALLAKASGPEEQARIAGWVAPVVPGVVTTGDDGAEDAQ